MGCHHEIPALLNSCKSVAKAYHSSINFARAIHEAQIKVQGVFFFKLESSLKIQNSIWSGSKSFRRGETMVFAPRCDHPLEQSIVVYAQLFEVWGRHQGCFGFRGIQNHEEFGEWPFSLLIFIFLYCQAGVKFGQPQIDLLKRLCRVLEPFYDATNQLSNDASCISEVS